MICKWCGAKIREKDRTCPRCGQEIPPLSECGGFYDLVPGARQGAVPPVKPVSPMQPTDGPTGYYPPRKKKKNYNTLWLCVWAVLLFAVLALSVKSCSLSFELDRLDDRLSKVEKEQKDMGDGEGTGEATAGDDDHSEDDSTPTDDATAPSNPNGSTPNKLTLEVIDNGKNITIVENSEDNNWGIDDPSDADDNYTLKFDEQDVFDLRFLLENDSWNAEIINPQNGDLQFQWDWEGEGAVPTSNGLTSTCTVSDNQTDMRCILTWEQDGQKYEVTINFPSDQTKPNGSD